MHPRGKVASLSRLPIPALARVQPPMSRPWQYCAGHAFGHRRASVAWSARAVRPAAASARALVLQSLGASAKNCNVLEPWQSSSGRASLIASPPELIGRSVSSKVGAMRSSPNSNTNHRVSIRLHRAALQSGCASGSLALCSLPVGCFGTRGRPNPSFKRTRLRRSA